MSPQARRENLSIYELAEETLVTDLQSHKVHALNGVAALIWRHCDGKTSVPELARLLPAEFQVQGAEELVHLRSATARAGNLLIGSAPTLSDSARLSRRDALKKLVIVAVSLPIVMTVTARLAKAVTDVGLSKQCPSGTTACGVEGPTTLVQFCCNNATETCIDNQCFAKQASGPPCLPIGNPCTKGQICCTKGGGTNSVPNPVAHVSPIPRCQAFSGTRCADGEGAWVMHVGQSPWRSLGGEASRLESVASVLAGARRQSRFRLAVTPAQLDLVAQVLLAMGTGGLGWWRVRKSGLRNSRPARACAMLT